MKTPPARSRHVHETGIAAEILEIAQAQAQEHSKAKIVEVRISVGDMSGVVAEALEFSFDALKEGPAKDAKLEIRRIEVVAECAPCAITTRPGADLVLWCEACGRPMKVLAGEELTVESVLLED